MKIIVSSKSNAPIYEQIKEQIKEQIMTGELKEKEFLPSIRQLAKELGISVITTTRAYSELEAEGFVATLQGKGTFVISTDNELVKEQYLKKIEEGLLDVVEHAKRIGLTKKEIIEILENLIEEQTQD